MKKSFFSVPRTLPLHALTTFLIGVGCVWPLSLSLGLTAPLEECVVCCGAVTLLFALLDCLPRLRALAYPLLLAGISGVAFAMRGQFAAVGAALALLVHGQPLALAAYSQEITLLLALVFTGIGASLSRSDQAFFPLALLEIALLFVVSFLGASVSAASLLPLILALLLSGRAPGVRARRIVPLCAAILAATALLMPLERGSILPASVAGVNRGQAGSPGQLKGVFDTGALLGDLRANTAGGIFGTLANADWAEGQAVPAAARRDGHPARRVFQALRIAVNGELDRLSEGLDAAFDCLNEGGRLAVITFHSLEDRMVKQRFAEWRKGCTCPPDFPVCVCGRTPAAEPVLRRPATASQRELEENPRSRSAKLRCIRKCHERYR